jgi:sporulation protein YlmC with PRC-barrel domain
LARDLTGKAVVDIRNGEKIGQVDEVHSTSMTCALR